MDKIIKAPEKKQRFKPISEEAIVEEFNKKVTSQNDNGNWGFTIKFIEYSQLILKEESYKNSQLGKYIREHSHELEDMGYHVESYTESLLSSVKVSW